MHRTLCFMLSMVLATVLFASDAQGREDHPPIFDKRPYAEAKKAAAEGKKWFIVKATAVWCPPCKQMDKTTWRDEKVMKWAEANAIVVSLDVDKESQLAQDLGIEAMPTMVAFKEGDKEFDRVVGYKAPAAMLSWLEGIAKGEKSIEAVRKRASNTEGEAGRVDVRARMDFARSLVQDRKYVEAADEYVWLWKNMLEHESSMYGVRLSFMAGDMQALAKKNKDARAKFAAIRDETGKRLDGDKVDKEDVADWVVLNNRVLDDTDATVKWYERVKDQPRWRPMIGRVSRDLTEMFIVKGRWADVGQLTEDPLASLESDWDMMKLSMSHTGNGLDEAQRKQIESMQKTMFRKNAAEIYAGQLAVGHETLAGQVAAKAREYDPSAAMVRELVTTALDADQPRAVQKEWVDAAKDETLNAVSKRLTETLEKKKQEQK